MEAAAEGMSKQIPTITTLKAQRSLPTSGSARPTGKRHSLLGFRNGQYETSSVAT